MTLYIFNDSTGRQRADFYETQLSEDVLWQGESFEAFESETGLLIAQLGGFKVSKGKLTYSQALKDAYEASQIAPQTPQNKLRELVALMKTLDLPTQASFLPVSSGVETALNAGNVPLAVFVVNGIDTQGSAELEALKQAVLAILEA
jgi:hypothetical protein